MSEFIIQQYYSQKKFKPGELTNVIQRLTETFRTASEDLKIRIHYPGVEPENIPGPHGLHNITRLKKSPYGVSIYLGTTAIFFGCMKKALQLDISKCEMNTAVIIRSIFEEATELNPGANTCFYCGKPNPDRIKRKTISKRLGSSIHGAVITRQSLKKDIFIPRCRRCARLAVLLNTLLTVLVLAGWALWIRLLSLFAKSAGPVMFIFLMFVFPLLTTAAAYGIVLLLARLLRFNFKFLESFPEYRELREDGWS